MKTTIFAAALGLFVAGLAHVETSQRDTTAGTAVPAASAADQAVVDRYCVTCHNARVRTAGLALDALRLADAARDAQTWEKVVRKLRTGMMPPSGAPRPDRAALDRLASAVEGHIDRAAAAAPNPGAPGLHRMNRTEYGNAVRDLLDLPIDAAALLPGDDSSEGFDNMASVLSVSPALMQAYVSAAAKISRLAVGDSTISPALTTYFAPRGMSQAGHREGMPLGTRGGLVVQHVFPLDAEYELRVGRAGGGLFGLPPVGTDDEVEITLNGERVRVIGRESKGPVRLTIPAGPQTIGVAVVRRANARGVDDLFSELANTAGVTSLGINGPLKPTGPGDTPSRRRIFTCRPAAPAARGLEPASVERALEPASVERGLQPPPTDAPPGELACARQILSRLATRALRRPVGGDDPTIDMLMEFFDSGRALRGFETGIQYALARLLVDPQFIYRFERPPAGARAGTAYRLDDLALASRLSFFLWSSIPDEELLGLASAGKLSSPSVLEQQTRRMLTDERARALIDSLTGQWLLLRQLDEAAPGTKEFDGNLRYAFRRETELLFETIVREDRSILDLIDADYTFVDERLARHYGIPNIRGSRFRRITLDDGARRGLLGHGSLLTVTSVANRTSPVKRGKWILENLLGAPVPLPPPGVETNLTETAADGGPTSLRQRLERHRASPNCASCHAVMDPVGFSLEPFDLIGRHRDSDGGSPVNATGQLADGTRLDGPASLRKALLDRRDAVAATATEKLLTYALGRRVEHFDMPAVRAVVRAAARDNYRFSSLVTGIVSSVPFQMKRVETE
jgi:mono/diheme cytochrome c family protein